jgi:hypothetical protein
VGGNNAAWSVPLHLQNDEFLRAVFHGLGEDECCWVTHFEESPKNEGGGKWAGRLHDPVKPSGLNSNFNTYFSIASFPSDAPKRRNQYASAVHCIVLDDVGQRISLDILDQLPHPSWVTETSVGCFQVGWILKTPVAVGEAKPVLDFLGKAGLGDTGGQNVVRYMRCPVGRNSKDTALDESGEPFAVRTIEWCPDRRIDLNDLHCALCTAIKPEQAQEKWVGPEQVPPIMSDDNPVVAFLRSKKMLRTEIPTGDGYLDIHCPCKAEHSSQGGTGYRPATAAHDAHFHCFHSHGPHLTTNWFHDWCLKEGLDKEKFRESQQQIRAVRTASQYPAIGDRSARYCFDATKSPLGLAALDMEPPSPEFIIDELLPDATIGIAVGTGGIGKTTRRLDMAVHVVVGRDYLGRKVLRPGPVVYLSGEDTRADCEYRLHHICKSLELTPIERQVVARELHIVDVVGSGATLVETKAGGDIVQSAAIPEFIAAYADIKPRLVIIDPKIAFSTGAEEDNTANRKFMDACARIAKELRCCVLVVHHVSKDVARNKIVDQHAGRGGAALADASRFVFVEVTHSDGDMYNNKKFDLPLGIDPMDVRDGNVTRLHVEKLTHARRPTEPFWQVRKGYEFKYVKAIYPDAETYLDRIQRIVDYVKHRRANGLYDSKNSLESASKELGMTRNAVRKAVGDGFQVGMLAETDVPADKKKAGFTKAIGVGMITYAQAKKHTQQAKPFPQPAPPPTQTAPTEVAAA